MLDRGFAPQVNQILSWTPRERQTALFSATMPAWVDEAARKHLRNPAHVAIDPTPAEAAPIEHVAYDVPAGGKLDALKDLFDARGDGQMIVFGGPSTASRSSPSSSPPPATRSPRSRATSPRTLATRSWPISGLGPCRSCSRPTSRPVASMSPP
jgi:hypothetical protein